MFCRICDCARRTIPFENLDPLLGCHDDLSPQALADKLVPGAEGRYCF